MIEPTTLGEMLEQRAAATPDRPAFHFADREWRYDEVWRGAGAVASRLHDLGLSTGDRVVLTLPNGPEFFFALYGVLRAGGIAVPVFPGSGPERVANRMSQSGARIVVAPRELEADAMAALESACTGGTVIPCPTPDEDRSSLPESIRPSADDIAMLQYTSGSTGEPKGVQLTHRGLLTNLRQMISGMAITPDDVFVSWLPVHHDMGLILMTMVPFLLGARLVLLPTSLTNTRTWLRTIAEHRGTFTAAPDFAYRLCLRTIRDPQSYDLSCLRVALNAAEPVRAATLCDFEERFGIERVMVAGYGLAEATVGVTMWPPGSPCRVDDRSLVSVGPPFPGIELKVVDAEGSPRPDGEIGRVLIRSPANTTGYWQDEKATAELLTDGYINSGDMGYLAADGRLTIAGRAKNVIISGGRNLAPQEIEEIVDGVDGVRFTAAVGVDFGRVEGEQPVVIAEVRRDQGDDAYHELTISIVKALYASIGLRPARVVLVAPRTIPRTVNGKVQHQLLRQRYLDGELLRSDNVLFPKHDEASRR
jgi:acyl-CoA synthetase (AMP-forming)/AMP-acid ligase II